MEILLVIFFTIFGICDGFLLPTTTQVPSKSGHYDQIMKLLRDEAAARSLLQGQVKQLQQELVTTKQECLLKLQTVHDLNVTFETQYHAMENRNNELKIDFERLRTNFSLLQVMYDEIEQNNTLMKMELEKQEKENLLLKKSSSENSREIIDIQNRTSSLQTAIKTTNADLNVVTSDFNSTKQDFTILKDKALEAENVVKNKTENLEKQFNMTSNLYLELTELTERELLLINRTEELEVTQNTTAIKLQNELDRMQNRVALEACAKEEHLFLGSKISFTEVRTTSGIQNIDSIQRTGVFTCETPGLYLISTNVMTDGTAGSVRITINGSGVAAGFFSITDHNVTASATVIARLQVNDEVAVLSNGATHVYGGNQSCLDIVQFQ